MSTPQAAPPPSAHSDPGTPKSGPNRTLLLVGFLALVGGAMALYWFFLRDLVTLEALVAAKDGLAEFTRNNIWWLFFAAALAYLAATAILLPTVVWLSILISYSFGAAYGTWGGALVATVAIYLGVLIGIPTAFFVVRFLIGDSLRARFGGTIDRISKGVEKDAFFYFLAMRLFPGVPFIVANAVPALIKIDLRTYFTATAIGILPGTFVYAYLGASLPTLVQPEGIQVSWQILSAFGALGALSVAPILVRKLTGDRKTQEPSV